MSEMFENSRFKGNLEKWNIVSLQKSKNIFYKSFYEDDKIIGSRFMRED